MGEIEGMSDAVARSPRLREFKQVREFLESWGLSYDTPDGDSSTIPYPAVYERMCDDAIKVGGQELRTFIGRMTDTTDSQTYLCTDNVGEAGWHEIEIAWEGRNQR
jgi:hypothetical protein